MDAVTLFCPTYISQLPKFTQLMTEVTKCSSDWNASRNVSFVKNLGEEAAEMAQRLRAVAHLPEDTGSIPSIHTADHRQM